MQLHAVSDMDMEIKFLPEYVCFTWLMIAYVGSTVFEMYLLVVI